MFHAWWTSEYNGEVKTLRFATDPRKRGLGVYCDIHGVAWDVRAIMGDYICARQTALHPNYYSTASWVVSQQGNELINTWIPYCVEVVTPEWVEVTAAVL